LKNDPGGVLSCVIYGSLRPRQAPEEGAEKLSPAQRWEIAEGLKWLWQKPFSKKESRKENKRRMRAKTKHGLCNRHRKQRHKKPLSHG